MCGIYITNIPYESEKIINSLKKINFRGPDSLDVKKVGKVTLGHLRLSILDLETRANQPMSFEELSIVFNGEIYNFKDIRNELEQLGYVFYTKGDTEVILKGYKEWGNTIVSKLNGMFAFAILDEKKQEIFCARDRLGQKPFYYYYKDGNVEICSQLTSIMAKNEINEESISIYLDCGYIPAPYSVYKNIKKLPAGKTITFNLQTKTYKLEEYWSLKKVKELDISYNKAKEQLHDLLKDAVKIRLQSDVPFGAFLSGGIDSALISSIAAEISEDKINTYSIGFSDPKYDESQIAAAYSKILATNHSQAICTPEDLIALVPKLTQVYDEPFADSSAIPTLLLNKMTKNHFTVAISGDGGDESFLGYRHFDFIYKVKYLFLIPWLIRKMMARLVSFLIPKKSKKLVKLLNLKDENQLIEGIFIGFKSLTIRRNNTWLNTFNKKYKLLSNNLLQKTADLNILLWLDNDSNVKVDRGSMAYSVEVRSPFLDYRIVEFARQLPIRYRYNKNVKKRILRDILKEYIPQEVFDQPKKGFSIPLGEWLKNELKEEYDASVTLDQLKKIPNLNLKTIEKLYNEHHKGINDNSAYLWRLFVLCKWLQLNKYYQ